MFLCWGLFIFLARILLNHERSTGPRYPYKRPENEKGLIILIYFKT
ncbi:protein of unknown function [Shewanella benthica]|uniref:Uncharacterized protein n=1 Tax=Shewanella benthica TaxID=43661 RepID=A0A330M7Y8_9GAMM|nr:protein of unknown function [Shewanella benthica]